MFNLDTKNHLDAIAVADCAIADLAVADVGYEATLSPDTSCSDLQPKTAQCAIADIAIADYAVADSMDCACVKKGWVSIEPVPYLTPYDDCDEESENVYRL